MTQYLHGVSVVACIGIAAFTFHLFASERRARAEALDRVTEALSGGAPTEDEPVVFLQGAIEVAGPLRDPDLDLRLGEAAVFERRVEMRQWVRVRDHDDRMVYRSRWREDLVDASRHRENRQNPDRMPVSSGRVVAPEVTLAGHRLSDALLHTLPLKPMPLTDAQLGALRLARLVLHRPAPLVSPWPGTLEGGR